MTIPAAKAAAAALPYTGLDRLRQKGQTLEAEKQRLEKATREFESFFTYYLMKTMRKTIPESSMAGGAPLSGSSGKDVFTDMFDMEIARSLSLNRGRSLSSLMFDSMEKLLEARFGGRGEDSQNGFLELPAADRRAFDLKGEVAPLPRELPSFREIEASRSRRMRLNQEAPSSTESRIARDYGPHIRRAARRHRLDPALILAVIRNESNGRPEAVSEAGAKGLMQLMDTTATDLGVENTFDPSQNIEAGSRYLRQMLDRYEGDPELALAAYNAGPAAVDEHGGVPPFRETQEYVARVLQTVRRLRGTVAHGSAKVR
jgi:Rod binding domain-containing protein